MIRRPMLYAACGTVAAVMTSYYAGQTAAFAGMIIIMAAVLFSSGLFSKRDRELKRRYAALILLVSYCFGGIAFWQENRILTEEAGMQEGGFLRGQITDAAEKATSSGDPFLQLTVKSEHGKVLANCYDIKQENGVLEGREATMTGAFRDPAPKRNPGCFDYALYLRSIGVVKIMTCDSLTVQPVRPFSDAPLPYLRNRISKAREAFICRLAESTDASTAAMMRAIMFGDKGGLDEETLETFQKNGTAHILAVSGLHIGIIYGFLLKLWRWRRGWLFFTFNAAFFLAYAAAAAFSPSVTRAVVMVLLHILAGIRGWRYDLNSAAFAVMIAVLLENPYMLFNAGFEMSFLAVLTLVLVLPYIKRFYSGLLLASLAVQIGLGPYILYQFNYLSLLAVVINVPVVALAGLIVPAGLVSMAAGSAGVPLSSGADEAVRLLCRLLAELNTAGQAGGITTLQIPSPPLWAMAAYYLALLLFATEEGRLSLIRAAHKGKYVAKTLVIIMMVSGCFHAFASDGFRNCDLTFVDVGQGDCMHLRIDDSGRLIGRHNTYNVLIDGGGRDGFDIGKKTLQPYLLKNGVGRIDLAIVTHLHTDHYDGIRSLCRMGMVRKLCVYEGYKVGEEGILEECGLDRSDLIYAAAGDTISLGDAHFTMLAPTARSDSEYRRMAEDEEDENKKSLLIKAEYHGVSAMMTGDIGEDGEREAMRAAGAGKVGSSSASAADAMRCDILKVGHHGSKTSSCGEFLDAVDPSVAVIQVGENNMYGHPTPEVLQRLADREIPVCRNDLQGAVGMKLEAGQIVNVKTMIQSE